MYIDEHISHYIKRKFELFADCTRISSPKITNGFYEGVILAEDTPQVPAPIRYVPL